MAKGEKSHVHVDLDVDLPGGLRVSTVRLLVDHGFGGTPRWYETMVFPANSYMDLACERYETEEEAIAGHAAMVERVMSGEVKADENEHYMTPDEARDLLTALASGKEA